MSSHDLKISSVTAVLLLLGIAGYAILGSPFSGGGDAAALQLMPAYESVAVATSGSKQGKLPMRWTHQRWGAI